MVVEVLIVLLRHIIHALIVRCMSRQACMLIRSLLSAASCIPAWVDYLAFTYAPIGRNRLGKQVAKAVLCLLLAVAAFWLLPLLVRGLESIVSSIPGGGFLARPLFGLTFEHYRAVWVDYGLSMCHTQDGHEGHRPQTTWPTRKVVVPNRPRRPQAMDPQRPAASHLRMAAKRSKKTSLNTVKAQSRVL